MGAGTGTQKGVLSYVSATSMTFTVTTPPTTAGTAVLNITSSVSASENVNTTFSLKINPDPIVTALAYSGTLTDVGVGSAAAPLTFSVTDVESGATIHSVRSRTRAALPTPT